MTYFVNDLSLYSPKNRACKKLLDFISQFEHVLIKDDCSLDALSSLIEDRIRESILRILNCGLSAIPGIIPFNVLRRLSCRLPVYRIMCSSWISAKCAAFFSILKKRLLFQVSAVFAGVLKMTLVTIRITEPAGGLMKSIHSVPIVQKKESQKIR